MFVVIIGYLRYKLVMIIGFVILVLWYEVDRVLSIGGLGI
jgi:hypothetical protein